MQFKFNADDLTFCNIDMLWKVEPSTFTVMVGNSSVSLRKTVLKVGS